jgi:CHAP domain
MAGEWWQKGYPGGKMVGPPFIRPLYPPSAASRGKTPSTNGGDVVAIKRAVWRGGRWPGPASGFDQAFSNAFAQGRSGNVSETGLAGAQRQNGIDPTGWMGEATYNMLRSARIPEGLPNAGQPLLDQTAIDLLTKFRKQYLGGDVSTVRAAALGKAKTFDGYKESPPGTNGNMFGSWYGMNYEPWCAMFVTYCYELGTDGGSPSFKQGSSYAYVPYIVSDARAKRNGLTVTSEPQGGDLVCYDWQGDGLFDHVGLFEQWTGGRTFSAIEGNTSTSNDSNGGQVMRRQRDAASTSLVFVRVAEP